MKTKKCTSCNKSKPLSEFISYGPAHKYKKGKCKICYNFSYREYNKTDARKKSSRRWLVKNKHYHRDWRRKAKQEVVNKYGGKCVDCGEVDPIVLTIDHVGGGGHKHRDNFYRWLNRNGFPKDGFELVCRNCNWRRYIKSLRG